jgi:hypothetical protein
MSVRRKRVRFNVPVAGNDAMNYINLSSFQSDERASARDVTEGKQVDVYFSVDIETDGPIPGPYSILSFAIVFAGVFDGKKFYKPVKNEIFYRELKPISNEFQQEALAVNGLDRERLITEGVEPTEAMKDAHEWILNLAASASPVLVAYPLSFDWTWLYWYFIRFNNGLSPFGHSRCYDIKTAFAVKGGIPISHAGRSRLPHRLMSKHPHTHHAVDDAIEQAEIFANVFRWGSDD